MSCSKIAPTSGAKSELFQNLYDTIANGNESRAEELYSHFLTESFKQDFGDWIKDYKKGTQDTSRTTESGEPKLHTDEVGGLYYIAKDGRTVTFPKSNTSIESKVSKEILSNLVSTLALDFLKDSSGVTLESLIGNTEENDSLTKENLKDYITRRVNERIVELENVKGPKAILARKHLPLIIEDIDNFSRHVSDFYTTINLNFKDSDIDSDLILESEESGRDHNFSKASHELNVKENVRSSTKLRLALVPDTSKANIYFGGNSYLNFDDVYAILLRELSNNTTFKDSSGSIINNIDEMLDRILKISKKRPEFMSIYNYLTNEKTPKNDIVSFYQAFNTQRNTYVSSNYSERTQAVDSVEGLTAEDLASLKIGTHEVKNITDSASRSNNLRKEWDFAFNRKHIINSENNEVAIAKVQGYVDMLNGLLEQVFKLSKSDPSMSESIVNLLHEPIQKLLVDAFDYHVDERAITDWLLNDTVGVLQTSVIQKITALQLDFKSVLGEKNNRISKLLSEKNPNNTLFIGSRILKQLGDSEATYKNANSEASVFTGTKNAYLYSNPSHLKSIIESWKNDPSLLVKLYNSSAWMQGSDLLRNLLALDVLLADRDRVSQSRINSLNVEIFTEYFEEMSKDSVEGMASKDMPLDDYIADHINKILSGYISNTNTSRTITAGDKTTDNHIRIGKFQFKDNSFKSYNSENQTLQVSDSVSEMFVTYLESEIRRMVEAKKFILENTHNKTNFSDAVTHYHYAKGGIQTVDGVTKITKLGNAFKSQLFPNLNFREDESSVKPIGKLEVLAFELRQLMYNKEGFIKDEFLDGSLTDSVEHVVSQVESIDGIRSMFKEYVELSLSERILNTHQSLKDKKILNYKSDNTLSSAKLDNRVIQEAYQKHSLEDRGLAIATDYYVNSVSRNIEYSKMFTGDIAYYKDSVDYKKRVPATYIDGVMPLLQKGDEFFKIAVIDSVEIDTPMQDRLEADFGKNIADKYKGTNSADAQAWITPNRWRKIMEGINWTPVHESVYNKMMSGEKERYTTEELKIAAQPVKGVYFYRDEQTGAPLYLKYSQAVLTPRMVKGSSMQRVYDTMMDESTGFDELVTLDGVKVGAKHPTRIHNEDGTLKDTLEFNIFNADSRGWRLQQDLPTKTFKSTEIGTQIQKNIFAGILHNLEHEFMDGSTTMSGQDILDTISETIESMSNRGLGSLFTEFQVDKDGRIQDINRYNRAIRDELVKRGASRNIVDALDKNMSINGMPQLRSKTEQMFASIATKRISKFKTNGGSFIQMSNFGLNFNEAVDSGVILHPELAKMSGGKNSTFEPTVTKKTFTIKHKATDPKSYTNHSGGAIGADSVFDEIGRSLSFENHNHYYVNDKTPLGNYEISEIDLQEGRYKVASAAARNYGYELPYMKSDLLIRNWAQVKHADAVFAIGTIVQAGEKLFPDYKKDTRVAIAPSVTGGTGYAVGMSILEGKPTYVFNQKDNQWYVWDDKLQNFTKTETPKLTKNYAGIGSRNLTPEGRAAIESLYKNTTQETYTEEVEKEVVNPAGVFISGSFIAKYIPNYKDYTAEQLFGTYEDGVLVKQGIIDNRILENLIGYRIPNQGLSSNDSMQIVGILPEENGDTVVAYTGITTKTGSDFDIDKMYVMMPSFTLGLKNKTPFKNFLKDYLKGKTMKETFNNVQDLILTLEGHDTSEIDMKGLVEHILSDVNVEEYPKIIKESFDVLTDIMLNNDNFDNKVVQDLVEKSGIMVEGLKYTTRKGTEGYDQNRLIEMYKAILTNKKVINDVLQPIDTVFFKNDIQDLSKHLEGDTNADLYHLEPIADIELKYAFSSGKTGVGQEANQMVDISRPGKISASLHFAFDWTGLGNIGLVLDNEYSSNLSESDIKYYSELLDKIDPKNKELILSEITNVKVSTSMSSIMNGFVDIAKDPFITRGNWLTSTTNNGNTLLRLGVHPLYVNALMAQPSIRKIPTITKEASKFPGFTTDQYILRSLFLENIKNYKLSHFKSEDIHDAFNNYFKSTIVVKDSKFLNEAIYKQLNINTPEGVASLSPESVEELEKITKHLLDTINNVFNVNSKTTDVTNRVAYDLQFWRNAATEEKVHNLQFQKGVLSLYRNISMVTQEIKENIDVSKADTVGLDGNLNNMVVLENKMYNLLNKKNKYGKKAMLAGFDTKFKNTPLGHVLKNLRSVLSMAKNNPNLFPDLQKIYIDGANSVAKSMGLNLMTDPEIFNVFRQEMYTGIMSDFFEMTSDKYYDILSNVPEELLKIKDKYGDRFELLDELSVRATSSNLDSQKGSVNAMIGLTNRKRNGFQEHRLTESWNELFKLEPEFAERLVEYSFASTGFRYSSSQFFTLIPHRYFIDKDINKFLKNYTNTHEVVSKFMSNQISNPVVASKILSVGTIQDKLSADEKITKHLTLKDKVIYFKVDEIETIEDMPEYFRDRGNIYKKQGVTNESIYYARVPKNSFTLGNREISTYVENIRSVESVLNSELQEFFKNTRIIQYSMETQKDVDVSEYLNNTLGETYFKTPDREPSVRDLLQNVIHEGEIYTVLSIIGGNVRIKNFDKTGIVKVVNPSELKIAKGKAVLTATPSYGVVLEINEKYYDPHNYDLVVDRFVENVNKRRALGESIIEDISTRLQRTSRKDVLRKLYNPDKTGEITKGAVVQYKSSTSNEVKPWIVWNVKEDGKLQLITAAGVKFNGTPSIEKATKFGSFPLTEYEDTQYIVSTNGNVFSMKDGKKMDSENPISEKIIEKALTDNNLPYIPSEYSTELTSDSKIEIVETKPVYPEHLLKQYSSVLVRAGYDIEQFSKAIKELQENKVSETQINEWILKCINS